MSISRLYIALCAAVLFATVFSAVPALAQEPLATPVATVNIYDATVSGQTNNLVTVSFDLYNQVGVQPHIRYAIELIEQDEKGNTGSVVADRFVSSDVVSLGEDTLTHRSVDYLAPDYLSGTYDVLVRAFNGSGLDLGSAFAGTIELTAERAVVHLSCREKGSTSGTPYDEYGITFSGSELECSLHNALTKDVTVRPTFSASDGVDGRKSIPTEGVATLVRAGRTVPYTVTVPAGAWDEIAYGDVALAFADTSGEVVSNLFRLSGEAKGTAILNVTLSRDAYRKGDVARATATIVGLGQVDGSVAAVAELLDGAGRPCDIKMSRVLGPSDTSVALNIPITRTCRDYTASVALVNEQGDTLDRFVSTIISPPQGTFDTALYMIVDNPIASGIIALIILALIVLAVRLGTRTARPEGLDSFSPAAGKAFVFALAVVGAIFVGGNHAHADTYTATGTWGSATFTYSLNKQAYAPGESMQLTLGTSCTRPSKATINGRTILDLRRMGVSGKIDHPLKTWTADSLVFIVTNNLYDTTYGATQLPCQYRTKTVTLQAPSSPGSHSLDLELLTSCSQGTWGGGTQDTNKICEDYDAVIFRGTRIVSKTFTVAQPAQAVSCTGGPIPSGAATYSGDTSALNANTPYTYSSTNTSAKCEFYCIKGSWNAQTRTCGPTSNKIEAHNPIGYHDTGPKNQQCVSAGWTCDEDGWSTPLTVDLYEGNTFVKSVKASANRNGLASYCGGTQNHGWETTLPARFADGQSHQITARVKNIGGGSDTTLPGNPVAITCPQTNTCGGTIPFNASAHDTEERQDVPAGAVWTHAASDSAAKCQFKCYTGYSWDGSSCILDTPNTPPPPTSTDTVGNDCAERAAKATLYGYPNPTIRFSVSPTSVSAGGSVTLDWGTNASAISGGSCYASGGWSGQLHDVLNGNTFGGTRTVGPLSNDTTFTIMCYHPSPGGCTEKSVTVSVAGVSNVNWTNYCTGGHDSNGNNWQIWAYDDSSPRNYKFVENGSAVNGCIANASPNWTNYCTGGHDSNGNNWQIWAYDDSSPRNYRFVENGSIANGCSPSAPQQNQPITTSPNNPNVPPPAPCISPWGQTLQDGRSVTAYRESRVFLPATCRPQTRTCFDGVLSGSYFYQTCVAKERPEAELTAPTRVRRGSAATISWTGAGDSCSITGPGLSSSAKIGSRDVVINASATFTLTCRTDELSATDSVSVDLVPEYNEY